MNNGVGEPSSAEECAINLDAWNALDDDLKQAVEFAAESLYNPVLTEYNTMHARSLRELIAGGTEVREWPEEIIVAMGNAMGEVMDELLADSDELVVRIAESFLEYRNLMVEYMSHSETAAARGARARLQLRRRQLNRWRQAWQHACRRLTECRHDAHRRWTGQHQPRHGCGGDVAGACDGAAAVHPRPLALCIRHHLDLLERGRPLSSCDDLHAGGPAIRCGRNGHVRVDIFYARLSPRRQAAIDIFGHLALLAPALIMLLYWSWPMVERSWAIREGPISVGGIPAAFLLKSLVPAFCILLLVQGTSALIRDLIRLREGG